MSGGTSDGRARRSAWGGARNRADRTSDHLSLRQAQAILSAGRLAFSIGCPLNRHITIHWSRAGIADGEAAAATGRLIKLATDWTRTQGAQLRWAWVRENDEGDGSKGSHAHILLHCPPAVRVGRMWRRWLRKVTGKPYRPGTIRSRTIGASLSCATSNPALYSENLTAVLCYLCKGTLSVDAERLGIPYTEPGGRVIGKRAAICQALAQRGPSE